MFNSDILEVVIGLVLIYFLLSLLATVVQEIIAGIWDFRGSFLHRALFAMLVLPERKSVDENEQGMFGHDLAKKFYLHPLINKYHFDENNNQPAYIEAETFSRILVEVLDNEGKKLAARKQSDTSLSHTNIQEKIEMYLLKKSINDSIDFNSPPYLQFLLFKEELKKSESDDGKYVQDQNGSQKLESEFRIVWQKFSDTSGFVDKRAEAASPSVSLTSTQLENLRLGIESLPIVPYHETGQNLVNGAFRDTRALLLSMVSSTVEVTRNNFEVWYNHAMDRYSGGYKQATLIKLFIVGFIISILFNADTIEIAKHLSLNQSSRKAITDLAIASTKENSDLKRDTTDNTNNEAIKILRRQYEEIHAVMPPAGMGWNKYNLPFAKGVNHDVLWYVMKLFGLLLTALAIVLKAPFWFDLLNKLINIRNTGRKPSPSEDGSGQGAGAAGNARHHPMLKDK